MVFRGPCAKGDIATAYAQRDALLFAKEGGEMVTSGKIYEYTATGKPIAMMADLTQDAHRVLADYPRAHVITDSTPEAAAQVMAAALDDAQASPPERLAAARAAGASWERGAVLRPAVARILAPFQKGSDRG